MTDPVADAARSAASILAPDLGQHLPVEVEAALAARAGTQRPDRYLDPVALGGLIVSVATLAWTIYNDLPSRRQEQRSEPNAAVQEPQAEAIARGVRNGLREQDMVLPPGTERITQVVVTEVIRQSAPPQELPPGRPPLPSPGP